MDQYQYVDSKHKRDFIKDFHNILYAAHSGKEVTFVKNGQTRKLVKRAADFGLLLLNCYPSYREDNEGKNWSYHTLLREGNKRHEAYKKYYSDFPDDSSLQDLLWFLLGDEIAPLVLRAWDTIPKFMYQSGRYRRSFRRPSDAVSGEILQINFLINLINTLPEYDLTLSERLEYDNVIGYYNHYLYILLLAVEDPAWKQTFLDVAYNRHPQIKISRLIIKAMLSSPDEELWHAIGDVLLAAQRQEGLRQSILEGADAGQLGAFTYLMKLILDNKLTRFSATLRAIETWIGLGWQAEKETTVRRFLELGYDFIQNPESIPAAIDSKDNAEVYMALWAQGVLDIDRCGPLLEYLWQTGNLEKQTLTLMFVQSANLPVFNQKYGIEALSSGQTQLIAFGLNRLFNVQKNIDKDTLVTLLGGALELIKEKRIAYTGKVFAWSHRILEKAQLYRLMISLMDPKSEEDMRRLLVYYKDMGIYQREEVARNILKDFFTSRWHRKREINDQSPTPFQKEFALAVLKDRSESIQTSAIEVLKRSEISTDQLLLLEDLLRRKSARLRPQVIDLLISKSSTTEASALRLLEAKNIDQRLAGLDMVIQLKKEERYTTVLQKAIQVFKTNPKIGNREEVLLDNILGDESEYTHENGFGLYDPSNIIIWPRPEIPTSGEFVERRPDLFQAKRKGLFKKKTAPTYGLSKPAQEISKDLEALKKIYLAHIDYEYTVDDDHRRDTVLLGQTLTCKKFFKYQEKKSVREQWEQFPLYDLWEQWYLDSGLNEFDLFMIQLLRDHSRSTYKWHDEHFPNTAKAFENILPDIISMPKIEGNSDRYRYQSPLDRIIKELRKVYPYSRAHEYFIGASQYMMAIAPESELTKEVEQKDKYYSSYHNIFEIRELRLLWSYNPPKEDHLYKSYYHLAMYKDQTIRAILQKQKDVSHYHRHQFVALPGHARAFHLGLTNQDMLMKSILKSSSMDTLTRPSRPGQTHITETYPFLIDFLNQARDRILDIELQRGDKSTAVTHLATSINQLYGQENFFRILKGLGKTKLHKGYIYSYGSEVSKTKLLSTLLKRCMRTGKENQTSFDEMASELNFPEKRWVEIALYTQQWSPMIRQFLGWDESMTSAIWWLHAHTNAYHSKETESEIAQYSPITLEQFRVGSVDVDWFYEVYKSLGKARWQMLYDGAKYITDGTGYTRAKLYADVLLGTKKIREVTKRVKDKRNQDYLRVYGLVPLSKKIPQRDVLNRYLFVQQFLKESKQFGAQRQESEKLAVQICLENLARTAGYADPIRLTWAMEAQQAKTILSNAETLRFDNDVEVSLRVHEGSPQLVVTKKGKLLKNIPAKLRKDKKIQELKIYAKQLKEQASRSRKSLEEALVRSDSFLMSEIQNLLEHPVITVMIKDLVFVFGDRLGFMTMEGLQTLNNGLIPLTPESEIRLAHPFDLYKAGEWEDYQSYCFQHQIKQAFKQVFRELYIPTPDELHKKTTSHRYEGHQVQPNKTVALLKGRGWRVSYEEGLQKVYHREGIIAKVYSMADWFSPAEIEAPTLETIEFLDKKTYKRIDFESLSPIIFSEVMRDMDLVVAVAHVGDVDPETSQSSVEMRAVLVRESAKLFKLANVRIEGRHVHIDGTLASYSIHLGSAQVFQKPGRQLGIIPVHSQHRGRIFLPFADDDPKSAELLSKVLMFAEDDKIQDPTILDQLNLVKS